MLGERHTVAPFVIDRYEVTEARFCRVRKASEAYVTTAETWGWSMVFHPRETQRELEQGTEQRVPQAPWWLRVDGANWRNPRGEENGNGLALGENLPVVQVSWFDAQAYCQWRGGRLPSEAEWLLAAWAGRSGTRYFWGDDYAPGGEHQANTWQGSFPGSDAALDGHAALAPVGSFPPNDLGLYDMAGNVWEWCADDDPATGEKVIRGGSWLCDKSYCEGYRAIHRGHSAADSGLDNTGFRCVAEPGDILLGGA